MLKLQDKKFSELLKHLGKLNPTTRKSFFKEGTSNYPVGSPSAFLLWWFFYYNDDFETKLADFHYKWIISLLGDNHTMIEGFRGSIKTALVKAIVTYKIANNLNNFIVWKSFTDTASVSNTTDIAKNLMNDKLIIDYGILFQIGGKKEDLAKKSVKNFDTTNGVKIFANSIGSGLRGANAGKRRPDLLILDDIDTDDSVNNISVIDINYGKLQGETFGAMSKTKFQIYFLGNTIKNDGIVPRFRKDIKEEKRKKYWNYFWQPLFNNTGKVVWDFFSKEMIEKIRATETEMAFGQNYLLKAGGNIGDPVFNQDNVGKLKDVELVETETHIINISILKDGKEISEQLSFNLDIFSKEKDVLIGVDVASGKGGDYSVIKLLDLENKEVARFRGNTTEPYQLAHILNKILELYNPVAKIGIESNNHGLAVITESRQFWWYNMLYRQKTAGKVADSTTKDIGWETNKKTKFIMIDELSKLINLQGKNTSLNLKTELQNYYIDNKGKYNALSGFYDDEIIATAIAYQMSKSLHFT